jgi:valyl-tRNA synthetase
MGTVGELCNVYMKIADLGLDFGIEVARQKKRLNELTDLMNRLTFKTSMADYHEKVPKIVQERNSERIQAYEKELSSINDVIKQLTGLVTLSGTTASSSSSSITL